MSAAIVRQWLEVRRSAIAYATSNGDTLWRRDVPMAFLPHAGAKVALWPDDDGDPDGVLWPVKEARWGSDGVAILELVPIRVDPDEETHRRLKLLNYSRESPWYTAQDGDDIEARLIRGGWARP